MNELGDEPLRIDLKLAGIPEMIGFHIPPAEAVEFLVEYLADDRRRQVLFPGSVAPTPETITNRFDLRWTLAIAYANKIWDAADRDGGVTAWEGAVTWQIRARLVEHVRVVDPLDIPRPTTPSPLGFRIQQATTTS
jgi:hypothetical protein